MLGYVQGCEFDTIPLTDYTLELQKLLKGLDITIRTVLMLNKIA